MPIGGSIAGSEPAVSAIAATGEVAAGDTTAVADTGVRQVPFAGVIGLSAFLLFSLELLAGRLVLPVFGGSPGVWTTCLCFFTAVLFVGYAYADVLARRLPVRRAGLVHLALASTAIALSFLAPSDIASLRNPGLPEALNVILVLAVVAGGPALLLATTTPLLSAWFARRGRNPWWLYAASNGASFVALLAYPFLVEPLIPLSSQRLLFSVGLVLMASLLAGASSRVGAGGRPMSIAIPRRTRTWRDRRTCVRTVVDRASGFLPHSSRPACYRPPRTICRRI
jgi:hypothetical protein